MLTSLRWVVGGAVGGAVGIAAWVLIGYFTQYEVGWIAWGIGFLVGVGVRYAAHLGDETESFAQGAVASLIAIGSIVTAKFLVFTLLVGGADRAELREAVGKMRHDEEALTALIADEIVEEMVERDQTVNWPPGMTFDDAIRQADYPPAIWRQAAARWDQLAPHEREERKRERLQLIMELSRIAKEPEFGESFSGWDLLWFGLAAFTAYKIGAGAYGED